MQNCHINTSIDSFFGLLTTLPPYPKVNVLDPVFPWIWITKRSSSVVDGSYALPRNQSVLDSVFGDDAMSCDV
jgi:hypothetical protein